MPDIAAPSVAIPAATTPWEASAFSGVSGAYATIVSRTNERGIVNMVALGAAAGNTTLRVTVDGQTPVVTPALAASLYLQALTSLGTPAGASPGHCYIPYNSSILIEASESLAGAQTVRVAGVRA